MKTRWLIVLLIFACGCAVNPAERNNTGNSLSDQGQYDSAVAAYQAAQVAAPDSPEAYYNAANAYGQQGEYDKAITALRQALKTTDPNLKMNVYYNLGNIYFQMGSFDDAVQAYQQVLFLNPNDEDARHNLELAIKHLVVPSPTPISPTEQPTDEGDSGITPASNLSNPSTATTSPTPEGSNPQPDTLTATSDPANLPPTISVDDAEGILDSVQQAQQSLPNSLLSGTPPPNNTAKDW